MSKEIVKQQDELVYYKDEYQEDEIDLVDLLKILYRNRKVIIFISFFVFLVGLAFAYMMPKKYKSEMTFVEQTSSAKSSLLSSLSSSLPFGLGSSVGGSSTSNLTTILESRKFREKVAVKLKLKEYIIAHTKMKEDQKIKFELEDAAEWLKPIVIIGQDTKTSVYKIEVEMEDKEMATKIANEYFVVLDDYLKNEKFDKSKISRQYLEKQVTIIEKEISDKQEMLKFYEEKYNTVSIDSEAQMVAESVAKTKEEIIKTESELNIARSVYGEESVDVVKLKQTLEELNKQLTNFKNGTGTVKFIPLKDIPTIKYKLEKLKNEIAATTEVYKTLRVQLENSKLEEINEQSLVELIDEAVIPRDPSSVNPKLVAIVSLFLGIFLGISFVFFREFTRSIDWGEIREESKEKTIEKIEGE